MILNSSPHAFAASGFSTTVFTDTVRKRSLKTSIWYPTATAGTKTFAENRAFKGFIASKDARMAVGKFPLYVLVHGASGNWKNLSWLASTLSNDGGIVIAADFPGFSSNNSSRASIIKMWQQAEDVRFLIGSILTSKYSKQIDRQNIFVIGYSLGGYSALALAGARLDMKHYPSFCRAFKDKSCDYFKSTFQNFDDNYYKKTARSFKDPRITASIAIAPGFVESMTNPSLKNIILPTLIIAAEFDSSVPALTHYKPKFKYFSNSIEYYEIKNASHFSFVQLCQADAVKVLAAEKAEFVCFDGGRRSRLEIHNELYSTIVEFIKKHKIP